jgi:ubiquinone/menaquinone biosynthesis C-methylase UbiE
VPYINAVNSQPFNDNATHYDAQFTDTPTARVLRAMVWQRMARHFKAPMRVLDLGCGTGEDAVFLAQRGVRVVAIDPAPAMISVAESKARQSGCGEMIEFHCLNMEALATRFHGEVFDGVYSDFGAVNCVSDLKVVVDGIATLLAPQAPLLWVVMGRHVPWEWLWYLPRGQWRKASRRLARGGTEWHGMTIRYPTPAELTEVITPHFSTLNLAPLGLALPPSYATAWLDRSPRLLSGLAGLERLGHRVPALAACADHYILEAVRLSPSPAH